MSNQNLFVTTITIVICLLGANCSPKDINENNVERNNYIVKLNDLMSSNGDTSIKKLDYSNVAPSLFTYISNSDFVVEAVAKKYEYVGKVKKQKNFDVSDHVSMYVFPFDIEKVLYSKDSNFEQNELQNVQLIVPPDELFNNQYKEGQKVLLFLKKVAKDENLSKTHELDRNRTYYRTFEGEKSILPNDGGFHSPPKKGRINISDSRYQDLIIRIRTFCLAINVANKTTKIQNLRNLTKSDDTELKNNAEFAIKVLQGNVESKGKGKDKDDGIQTFIDVLTKDKKETSSSEKVTAIKKLGNARIKRSIPTLIKYIDFEDKSRVTRSSDVSSIDTTEQDDLPLSGRYPAVGALFQMGKHSLPALIDVLENNKNESIKSQNAVYAVQQIYSEDWLKAVLYLEKASTKSKTPNGSERLQSAAQKIRVQWEKLQKLKK